MTEIRCRQGESTPAQKDNHSLELECIINRCPVVVFVRKDTPGRPFAYVSEGVSRFGYDADDFVSGRMRFRQIVHPNDLPRLIREVKQFMREGLEEFSQEYRIYTKSGEMRWVDVRTIVRKDTQGNISNYQGIMIDITANKEIERIRLAHHLAENAARQKNNFLVNMSHEIRTPMNAVIGLTDLLLKTDLAPKQQDYVEKIRSASQSLLRIINEILDLSKLDAGKMTIESVCFDLQEVMDHLVTLFAGKAEEKGIEFILSIANDVPCALIGDPYRIGQILSNLTGNAIKFTEKGEVSVRVELEQIIGDRIWVQFSVRDTGIGIDPEKIPTLFSEYTQAEVSTTRKYGGTGLGLAICQRLVQVMGGRIWVKSEPKKGSVFYVSLNFSQQPECYPRRLIPAMLHNARVLVADDNPTVREILCELLASYSFDVAAAESGEAVVEELLRTQEPYCLVIADWNMPGTDSVQMIRQIRNIPELKHIPLIAMVTAFGSDDIIQQAQKAGVDAFVFKPVNRMVLLDTILDVFKQEIGIQDIEIREVASPSSNEYKLRSKRVLVVEDNSINQQVAAELLESAGVTVELAQNGVEAIRALKKTSFDAVLMDLELPDMDGYETARIIRNRESEMTHQPAEKMPDSSLPYSVPIIAMSAHVLDDIRKKCIEAGMNDYVAKPVSAKELYAVLAKWTSLTPRFRSWTAADEADLPDSLPGIDIQTALIRLNGRKKLLKNLLRDLARDYPDVGVRIQNAVRCGDMETALRLIHTMKGVSANIGAGELQAVSNALEQAIRYGPVENADNLMKRFQMVLENVIQSVQSMDPRDQKTPAPVSEPPSAAKNSHVVPLMIRLYHLLCENDLRAEDCFDSAKPYLLTTPQCENAVGELEDAIHRLDFKRALSRWNDIAQWLNILSDGDAPCLINMRNRKSSL